MTAPVLAIHSRTDADVPFDQSVHAAQTLPDARLEAVDEGTHLSLWLGSDAPRLQSLVVEHLSGVSRT